MADEDQEVIIVTKKVKEEGAHGGAWKIAYADFVTAMMAFFLLLWLLNATEQEVLEGISNYFNPTTRTTSGASGSGGLFGGITSNEPGPTETMLHSAAQDRQTSAKGALEAEEGGSGKKDEESTGDAGKLDPLQEDANFYATKQNLERAINALPPELQDLKQSVLVDVTEEGLRLQLIDQENRESFAPGSAELTETGRLLLKFIAQYISRLPNKISITGHTGQEPAADNIWTLSVDRALTTRRTLIQGESIPISRFETIIGRGDSELMFPDDPTSPRNRRMVVVLLRQVGSKSRVGGGNAPPSIFGNPQQ